VEYSDTDPVGIDLPQAVCWERLKYDILPRIDIPCRIEVANRRVKLPVVRARLRTIQSDELGYFHTVRMYLHRVTSLGAFGPKFQVFCQADGRDATLLQLRAHADRAFESKGITRLLAWGYGTQWRISKRLFGEDAAEEAQKRMGSVRVHFDNVPAYDFGQLTREGLNDGFHRRGYAYIADLLRAELGNGSG
jgi:hypothetical protein